MKIPPNAEIPPEKLTRYFLVPRAEDDKSKFLAQAGFTATNPQSLLKAIHVLAISADAHEENKNDYGVFFSQRGQLVGPSGKHLNVVLVWLRQHGDGAFRLVTLKPWRRS